MGESLTFSVLRIEGEGRDTLGHTFRSALLLLRLISKGPLCHTFRSALLERPPDAHIAAS